LLVLALTSMSFRRKPLGVKGIDFIIKNSLSSLQLPLWRAEKSTQPVGRKKHRCVNGWELNKKIRIGFLLSLPHLTNNNSSYQINPTDRIHFLLIEPKTIIETIILKLIWSGKKPKQITYIATKVPVPVQTVFDIWYFLFTPMWLYC
jgi:hypothetical protein